MQLPGGRYRNHGIVEREWAFKPLDGHVELALWEAWRGPGSKVDCITRAIASTVEFPDCQEEDEAAAGLSVADRQFLLAQLACHLGASQFWLSADCQSCREPFDTPVDLVRVPVKPAGPGYPFAEAAVATGPVTLRVPTGADQAAIEELAEEAEAVALLARRCIVGDGESDGQTQLLTGADLVAIDAALQEVAPELATAVASSCPSCGAQNAIPFEVSALLHSSLKNPLQDVHDIAAIYHWAESEILALPRARRHAYLALINQRRGMFG